MVYLQQAKTSNIEQKDEHKIKYWQKKVDKCQQFKVNKYFKLTIKISEPRNYVFNVKFEHIAHLFLVFLLLLWTCICLLSL